MVFCGPPAAKCCRKDESGKSHSLDISRPEAFGKSHRLMADEMTNESLCSASEHVPCWPGGKDDKWSRGSAVTDFRLSHHILLPIMSPPPTRSLSSCW